MTVNLEIISKVYKWLNIDLRRPCLLCALPCAGDLCPPCLAGLPWETRHQCRCGLPKSLCPSPARCLAFQLPIDRIQSCFRYAYPVDRLINRYKHQHDHATERVLERLWCSRPVHGPAPDALVPTPLHWRRQFARGFNQAHRLARALGKQTGIPVQPILRRRRSAAQQGLDWRQRADNLSGHISCTRIIAGGHLALIDDVVTTGATAGACAEALLQAGASRVDVYCLARTPPPTFAG